MASDFEIGRVVSVDTSQVLIELNPDLRSLTRTTHEGAQEVGRINSYVILPVGARRLVAIVTRVLLTEEAEVRADRTMVTLPSARRVMKATLIGTIDRREFRQGVSVFPILDNPVHLAAADDLDLLFGRAGAETQIPVEPEKPGFCLKVGESTVFDRRPILINPDAFFGKHAAVLGSTGSGKSCTIAAVLQAVLARAEVQRTTFVVLDTNGEYRSAFQSQGADGQWNDIGARRCLYVPSDAKATAQRLTIPYWFLNSDDFVRLFRASQGVQRPVLLEALRMARNDAQERGINFVLREELVYELGRIRSRAHADGNVSRDVVSLAVGLRRFVGQDKFDPAWPALQDLGVSRDDVQEAVDRIIEEARAHLGINNRTGEEYPRALPADARDTIRGVIDPIHKALTAGNAVPVPRPWPSVSADAPHFFDKLRFRGAHLEQVLRREESGGNRARDFSGTMLLRIDRLMADQRFEFLLGPVGQQWPSAAHSLATFLRDLLGLPSHHESPENLSPEDVLPQDVLPFYDRQRGRSEKHHVVILDLSLLASEVLENVTALIGRLIFEFLQRIGDIGAADERGSLPVVLVLEEAQNYIREPRSGEEDCISRQVFERIAREGRKHGLGLVVASQRPSELSKTVLSQCSSFIVHRLQNPEDLRYFKEVVPSTYGDLLNQLPSLASQTALVLGECVRVPALVRIRDAEPLPRSRDPKFYSTWIAPESPPIPVEEIAARWEGTGG